MELNNIKKTDLQLPRKEVFLQFYNQIVVIQEFNNVLKDLLEVIAAYKNDVFRSHNLWLCWSIYLFYYKEWSTINNGTFTVSWSCREESTVFGYRIKSFGLKILGFLRPKNIKGRMIKVKRFYFFWFR